MTEQQRKKMEKKTLYLSIGIIGLAVVFLIICGIKGLGDTIVLPIGIGIFMLAYWVVSDVLSVFWLNEFAGKTDAQKRSYYYFAAMDGLALAGLVYFLIDMNSMAGVLVYVLFNMMKRKYKDEFLGVVSKDTASQTEDAAGQEEAADQEDRVK